MEFIIETGFRRLKNNQKMTQGEKVFYMEPKLNCGKCYGRGFVGNNIHNGVSEPIPCPCLFVIVGPDPGYVPPPTPEQKAEAAFEAIESRGTSLLDGLKEQASSLIAAE